MKNFSILIVITFIFSSCVPSKRIGTYTQNQFEGVNNSKLPYNILYPKNFDSNLKNHYPVLLFLHGAGERGNDNKSQLKHVAPIFLKDDFQKEYPCIVIIPQCAENDYWANIEEKWSVINSESPPTSSMNNVIKLMQKFIHEKFVDKNRIYVAGLSMGGFGTFDILSRNPELFAAAISVCGGADLRQVDSYKHIPLRIYHGAKDPIVPVQLSREVNIALASIYGNNEYFEFPEGGHLIWDEVFNQAEIWDWLFNQGKR